MERSMREKIEKIIKEKRTLKAELAQEVSSGYRLNLLDEGFEKVRAFMPGSKAYHYGTKLVDIADIFHVHVIEISEKYPNSIVVSGMGQLKAWIYEQECVFMDTLKIGQQVQGEVEDIKDYGVFINLGPMTGLLHASKIPAEFKGKFRKGDPANVIIDSVDPASHRIGLKCREKKVSPSRTFRRIMGRQKVYGEKGVDLSKVEAAELKKLLMAMTVEEVQAALPKLRQRADWGFRKILGGKYDWFSEIKEVV